MFQGVLRVKINFELLLIVFRRTFCYKFAYYNQNVLHYFMLVKHIIKISKQKAFYHTDRERESSVVCGQIGLWVRNQWGIVLQLSLPENSNSQRKTKGQKG